MPKEATRYLEVDPWIITEKGYHKNRSRVSESMFSLANEYMGVRGYFEEGYSGDCLRGSFFNGIFEERDLQHAFFFKGLPTRNTFMVNSVDWLYTRISINGQKLDLNKSKITKFKRSVDMREGILERQFIWHIAKDKKILIKFLRFVSMKDPNLGGQRITFEPLNFSGSVKIRTGLDFSVIHEEEECQNHWQILKTSKTSDIYSILAQTNRSQHKVFSSFRLESEQALKTKLIEIKDEKFIGVDFSLKLKKGNAASVDKMVINYSDKHSKRTASKVFATGMSLAKKHKKVNFDEAICRHKNFWAKIWQTLDITIEGDPLNQQGIRFSIFQLHQSYHGVDPTLNIGAKGLTAEKYLGCAWWDTETYCLPFYLFNNPKATRNLLGYRYETLPGAINRAKELDCEGARYPMCTHDGSEICGVWQHGDLEIHISGAVAYGIWHYDKICDDKKFLYTKGIEMLLQISRYYASRGEWSPITGEFGFWGVMGADEFHMMVHNNCYTNVMAKKSFEFTLKVIAQMKKADPQLLKRICKKIKLRVGEPNDWKLKAKKMRIPQDKETGILEQHDGYFDMPHLDLKKVPATDFPLYENWAYVKIFRYDMIKQPDVLLLPFFFSNEYSDSFKQANYEYYAPRCSHESSLSPSIHAIMASELGKHKEAYDYSLYAARLDLDDYNRNTREGLHVTSMAGAWLNMVYGFGGMRSDDKVLTFKPSIPKKWKSFSFRILYKGSILKVNIDKQNVLMSIVKGKPVTVKLFDKKVKINKEGILVAMPADRVA